jgi:3'-5' exonuclease
MDIKQTAKNLLFIDIETASGKASFGELSERMQRLWLKKASFLQNLDNSSDEQFYFDRAAIYAEFAKVITIGMGFYFYDEDDQLAFRVKSIAGDDEAEILETFKALIEKKYRPNELALCAHNGKEFDFPFLCRRFLVNGIEIPKALQLSNRKPWEVPHLDTMEMWKFGDKKSFTSLDLLSAIFDISSSKTILSGDEVNHTYYIEKDLEKIARYCREDVVVMGQLYLKYNNLPLIPEDRIVRLD